jgi:hypothetical protein
MGERGLALGGCNREDAREKGGTKYKGQKGRYSRE